ncbi:MAG: hypothetical protein QNK27_14340 [Desulfuromusa sp.]|nr:hypothetical protein [Desulfuromusa sp.]
MEIRHAVHPEHAQQLDTEGLREQFLIQKIFNPGEVKLIYSYIDRLIVGGVCPLEPLTLEVDKKIIGAPTCLTEESLAS